MYLYNYIIVLFDTGVEVDYLPHVTFAHGRSESCRTAFYTTRADESFQSNDFEVKVV